MQDEEKEATQMLEGWPKIAPDETLFYLSIFEYCLNPYRHLWQGAHHVVKRGTHYSKCQHDRLEMRYKNCKIFNC